MSILATNSLKSSKHGNPPSVGLALRGHHHGGRRL